MSRDPTQAERFFGSFPRVSGDEPAMMLHPLDPRMFSLRERG